MNNTWAMQMVRPRVWLAAALATLTAVGCGGGKADVSGTVRYRGQPLPAGTVTFFNDKNEVLGGSPIRDGHYEVASLPQGTVKIAVSTPSYGGVMVDRNHPAPKDMPKPNVAANPVLIPPQYSSPDESHLTYEIHSGAQDHPIDLN